jgi:hypothetical protein
MLKHDPGRVTISVVIPLHPIPLCSRYKMGNLSGGSTASLGQPQFYDFKKNLHKKGSRSSASALKSNFICSTRSGLVEVFDTELRCVSFHPGDIRQEWQGQSSWPDPARVTRNTILSWRKIKFIRRTVFRWNSQSNHRLSQTRQYRLVDNRSTATPSLVT